MLARAVRALDEELNFEYLAQIAEHEQALIDGIVAGHPPTGRIKVSIVVPTYEVPMPYVRELIASVERQSYDNWELCFADDGDPLTDVADHLAGLARARPERFKYARHPENRGIAAATRTGLGLVTGDVVAFADADDLLHRRALEVVASRFEADPRVDFVYTDHDTTSDLGFRRAPIRKPAFSPELLQSVNYVNHLVVVRRSCLDRVEGAFADGTSGSQDWDLCYRLIDVARRVSHVPAVLYHWRGRPGSIAGDTYAKPWVHDACVLTRERHLTTLDPRLCVVPEESAHRFHYEPGLAPDIVLPPLRIVTVSSATTDNVVSPDVDYAGEVRRLALTLDETSTNADLLDRLRDACGDDPDALVWILEIARPVPEGTLDRLIAFAIQDAVGAVWPFRRELIRLCYTRHRSAPRLAQLTHSSNVFSRFSGNVLTGPLHGMLTRVGNLRAALDELARGDGGADAELRERRAHVDSVGASLGLAMLAAGRRNVGCRGMMCDVDLDDASVPHALLPPRDPWI